MEKGGPRPSLFSLYPPFRRRLFVPGGAEEKLTAWLFVRGHGKQKKTLSGRHKKGGRHVAPGVKDIHGRRFASLDRTRSRLI